MKNSIIAGKVARDLANEYKPDGKVYSAVMQLGQTDLWVHARACTIKRQPSGGALVWASINAPSYASPQQWTQTKRIKRNDQQSIYRHAADLAEYLRQERCSLLVKLRERVYETAEAREIDANNIPAGYAQDYENMTEADCNFWLGWLRQQPQKVAA